MDGWALHLQLTDDCYTSDEHEANQQVASLSLSLSLIST